MRLSLSMKVGLVSLFSCLALLLGQLSSMSMALAHTANHSSTTRCLKGTVSAVTYDQRPAPHVSCIGDPPIFRYPPWIISQDRARK